MGSVWGRLRFASTLARISTNGRTCYVTNGNRIPSDHLDLVAAYLDVASDELGCTKDR